MQLDVYREVIDQSYLIVNPTRNTSLKPASDDSHFHRLEPTQASFRGNEPVKVTRPHAGEITNLCRYIDDTVEDIIDGYCFDSWPQ